MPETRAAATDPALLAVLSNRFDYIIREMTNTLLRAGRSAVLNTARDFSCSVVTANDELVSAADGVPVHVLGAHLQTAEMRRLHPGLRPGDAFLDNDPYVGNTHHADHTILVPVFLDGVHRFTTVAKAHQADIGNSQPTTYMPFARDIYEEGALSFPCVQVQRDGKDIADVIRMARRRIRVDGQWYGDYLAMLGAARIAERRLQELAAKYGVETLDAFVRDWLDYSERRAAEAIGRIPTGTYVGSGQYDSFGPYPAVPITVTTTVASEEGRVTVDMRDNPDCAANGINLSRATSINSATTAVLNLLGPDVPHNAGTFRRIEVKIRENCVVGAVQHPTSCSMATTNVADRVVNIVQSSLTAAGPEFGLPHGGSGQGPGLSVISGIDPRTGGAYVNQMIMGCNGGPASPHTDGWLTWLVPVGAGMLYRDSVEIDEVKYPIRFDFVRIAKDSGGPGRFRGAPGLEVGFGPTAADCVAIYAGDCHESPPQGVHGGLAGSPPAMYKLRADGTREELPPSAQVVLRSGEIIVGRDVGGGGFGDPLERDPERVRRDVAEGWVSPEQAHDVHGVVLTGSAWRGDLAVDTGRTEAQRTSLAAAK
jgi:N-methylhydantoinase B